VLVEWNYSPDYRPQGLDALKKMGFSHILMAPSVSCWRNRVIPSTPQLRNVDAHAAAVRDGLAGGMINTVWLPMRYVQDAMWYGMAYGAFLVQSGKPMNRDAFHKAFVKKMFGMPLDRNMNDFLNRWSDLHLDRSFFEAIAQEDFTLLDDQERIRELEDIRARSAEVLALCPKTPPIRNPGVMASMCLSAEIIYVLSEGLLILADGDVSQHRRNLWVTTSSDVITRAGEDWDRGRYRDDPAKFKAKFPNQTGSHLLVVLRQLRHMIIIG
jgi:hypothetical protein